jgi:hypothetical protein
MNTNSINVILKVLSISFILIVGCKKEEQDVKITDELQKTMDDGATIDSIALDYATITENQDNYYVIKPKSIETYTETEKKLIYFKCISKSRNDFYDYCAKQNNINMKHGFTADWILKFYDKLENISIEFKKNGDEFYQTFTDSSSLKFFDTPIISSGQTFERVDMTTNEFLSKYKTSFPGTFVMMFADPNMKPDTYVFKITFIFNNNKKFTLYTGQLNF